VGCGFFFFFFFLHSQKWRGKEFTTQKKISATGERKIESRNDANVTNTICHLLYDFQPPITHCDYGT